jgi:hypothetical protein
MKKTKFKAISNRQERLIFYPVLIWIVITVITHEFLEIDIYESSNSELLIFSLLQTIKHLCILIFVFLEIFWGTRSIKSYGIKPQNFFLVFLGIIIPLSMIGTSFIYLSANSKNVSNI